MPILQNNIKHYFFFISVREVYEETGYNIAEKIDPNMYITKTINDQECGLFLIPGVPMNTKFKPIAKFEIRDIDWFALDLLPSSKNDPIPPGLVFKKPGLVMTYNSLFMVSQDFNQRSFLSKIQNRIGEKTRRKIVLLSCKKFVKTQFLGVVEFPSIF